MCVCDCVCVCVCVYTYVYRHYGTVCVCVCVYGTNKQVFLPLLLEYFSEPELRELTQRVNILHHIEPGGKQQHSADVHKS